MSINYHFALLYNFLLERDMWMKYEMAVSVSVIQCALLAYRIYSSIQHQNTPIVVVKLSTYVYKHPKKIIGEKIQEHMGHMSN